MQDGKITIVTAFFDIGRGDWTEDKGHPSYLKRSNEQYFQYFENLALLENKLIIFTSEQYKAKVRQIRGDKPTEIITLDIHEIFSDYLIQIEQIQKSDKFISQVKESQLRNPEYWSPEYVLITNLKSYFVNFAINSHLVATEQVAWVDFGYCRDIAVTNNIVEWVKIFEPNKIHLFTIKKNYPVTMESVKEVIFSNRVFIIGGAIVGSQDVWIKFSKIILDCQKELLESGIVDDDQGVFMMALYKAPDLFKLNYLGKNKWFDLFKRYDQTSKFNIIQKIKEIING